MSGSAPIESAVGARSRPRSKSYPTSIEVEVKRVGFKSQPSSWCVRAAAHDDVPAVTAAVRALLLELGATPPAIPAIPAMEAAARALLDDRQAGVLLVAEAGGALVGVLGASWQTAMHIPGRYALIQDLWVDPSWRGGGVGRDLLAALFALARERQIACAEVGLPRGRFSGLAATEAFYRANGFAALGARMRRSIA
jgi:GNAT superfamily N-acetyltransferase